MGKIQYKHVPFAAWHRPKMAQPSDQRDVLAYIKKPVWVEANKRFELMEMMEVIHMESNGAWFLNGKPLPPKNVLKWTEIPTGWND